MIKGYLIVPTGSTSGYRGIDRNPFGPELIPEEFDKQTFSVDFTSPKVWQFYPSGWRRDAYRLYEENSVTAEDLELIDNLSIAVQIKEMISPHVGTHTIMSCAAGRAMAEIRYYTNDAGIPMGYDIAYPGGDYYSAIMNGLFINPAKELLLQYKKHLNGFGLFDKKEVPPKYLEAFRRVVRTETDSDFWYYKLFLIGTS